MRPLLLHHVLSNCLLLKIYAFELAKWQMKDWVDDSSKGGLTQYAIPKIKMLCVRARLRLRCKKLPGDSGATTTRLSSQSESRTGLHILTFCLVFLRPWCRMKQAWVARNMTFCTLNWVKLKWCLHKLILLDGGSRDRSKVTTMFLILAMEVNYHLTHC